MTIAGEREAALRAQGWRRQALLEEPRLSEMAQAYRDLGFEVLLEPVDPTACVADGQCTACFADPEAAGRCKVVYTRPAPGPA